MKLTKKEIIQAFLVVILAVGAIFLIVRAGAINPPPAAWDPENNRPNPTMKPLSSLAGFPHTGLDRCYDNWGYTIPCGQPDFPRQDGDHYYPFSYTVNGCGEGTVKDNLTGLCWEMDGANLGTWQEALMYCMNLGLAGHQDWRLPNAKELISFLNYQNIDLASDPTRFYFPQEDELLYWSSTTFVDQPSKALIIDFRDGFVLASPKISFRYFRCVKP